jgi:hypothetical protein
MQMRGDASNLPPNEMAEPATVRHFVWVLLAAALVVALVVALLAPALTHWHAAQSSLAARACVWPAAPSVNRPIELRVVLPNGADREAVHGPWAHVIADWDMVTLSMGSQEVATAGDSGVDAAFVLPLRVTMAGSWWVQVALRTPGRPEWRAALHVHELAASGSTGAAASYTARSRPVRAVLQLVGEAYTNQEIAARPHISIKTVQTHRAAVMEKLGLRYAVRRGLVDPER